MAYIYSFSSGNGECFHGRLDLSIFAYLTKSCGKADDRSHEPSKTAKENLATSPLSGCPRDMWSFGGKKGKIRHAFFWIRNFIDNQEEFK